MNDALWFVSEVSQSIYDQVLTSPITLIVVAIVTLPGVMAKLTQFVYQKISN